MKNLDHELMSRSLPRKDDGGVLYGKQLAQCLDMMKRTYWLGPQHQDQYLGSRIPEAEDTHMLEVDAQKQPRKAWSSAQARPRLLKTMGVLKSWFSDVGGRINWVDKTA